MVKAKTGAPLYPNRFLTPHRLPATNGAEGAPAGRGRWKSENDNHHVRQTKGDHLEHNFGPGQHSLAAFLLCLNLLAFLLHPVLEWSDDQ